MQEAYRYLAALNRSASGAEPVVACFDLDRTLIQGYSLTALARQQIAAGEVGYRQGFSLARVMINYSLGRCDYHEVLRATLDSITGMPEAALQKLGRDAFHASIVGTVYQAGQALIEAHRNMGHHVIMITSATRYQAQPVAELLAIPHLRCTELEMVAGQVSGHVYSCYGPGKLAAAEQFAHDLGANLKQAYFYTDSQEDLPLLEQVGYPVVVNGKRKLKKIALARGWPMLHFNAKLACADVSAGTMESTVHNKAA
ncbi:MAG: HAD family hydrolase [Pseudomonadota bacterium]